MLNCSSSCMYDFFLPFFHNLFSHVIVRFLFSNFACFNYRDPMNDIKMVHIPHMNKDELSKVVLISSSNVAHVTSTTNKDIAMIPDKETKTC